MSATTKRRSREVETMEYLETVVRRTIVTAGKRVADSDEPELAKLLEMRKLLDEAIQVAVDGQHERTGSWAYIGRAAGITRSAAFQKWGRKA
jgi:hypothetical protein